MVTELKFASIIISSPEACDCQGQQVLPSFLIAPVFTPFMMLDRASPQYLSQIIPSKRQPSPFIWFIFANRSLRDEAIAMR